MYAIAMSKIWDSELVGRIEKKIGQSLVVITRPEELTKENLAANNVKKIFFPHWSHIIKPDIHDSFECVIFHMTDLPFGRGGSPLQNLISRGIYKTKISALKCSLGVDTGPVYLKKDLNLDGTAQEIFARATGIIETMIMEILEKNPVPVEQTGEVTTFKRRKPEDSNLVLCESLTAIYDYIRMLDAEGYPKAYLEVNGVKYEFTGARFDGESIVAQVRITK
ncbi:methionyl-tRNA formyltransferase [Bacteriovorax stolpii]|nr:hypothetical protein [Bacteriovorax stolpii]TDP53099.1 methionyl-tRNA formyltransferase [Bacteriovorax stolpii]